MRAPDGGSRRTRTRGRAAVVALAAALVATAVPTTASAQDDEPSREGLRPGLFEAESAHTPNIEHLSFQPRIDQAQDTTNSDMAFFDDHVVVGNYGGFNIYDVSDPSRPRLRTAVICRGGQADVSVEGDLLFLSVEQGTGFEHCDAGPNHGGSEDATPFRGIRIFDISDLNAPQLVNEVQTCRGSHTHTLVHDPEVDDTVWVYVSGTIGVRSDVGAEGLDCVPGPLDGNGRPSNDPADHVDEDGDPVETDRFRIDIIEVPLDAPEDAELLDVPETRLFAADPTDPGGSNPVGLQWEPPTEFHPSGPEHRNGGVWSPAPITDACHDITAYAEYGIAAGACEGNGILIDITDPRAPTRITEVADPNFSYWHSATFNNDATKVIFTDEWGGGGQAYCTDEERPEWGANGIYDIVEGDDGLELEFASYYKIPPDQETNEICVAHNGNLIPIPGRDVMVQAWYQGGLTVFDFTDSANPVELAWFDRGPIQTDPEGPQLRGGFWSAYWYNGHIYATDISRGFDSFRLLPDDFISAAELEAAMSVRDDQNNPQAQHRFEVELPPEGPACDAVEGRSFPDVVDGPHAANVGCVAAFGIALGSADGTYRPANDVRRDQMASFLQRVLEVSGQVMPDVDTPSYPDTAGNTHEVAIAQLEELGIVQGRADGSYAPASSVTRAQMASFLVRTMEVVLDTELAAAGSPFTDTAGSPHAGAIDVAHDLGVALGRTATTYAPNADVRRDQMASFLARTLDVLQDEGIALTPVG
ncbi:hypothetical protein FTX61_06745 [Nitriliruptoraceae bacterium ZYF776]|nr:hypothetical protein [Profundirhabdus halotolerans]